MGILKQEMRPKILLSQSLGLPLSLRNINQASTRVSMLVILMGCTISLQQASFFETHSLFDEKGQTLRHKN